MMARSSQTTEIPALGCRVWLGMLYDCCRDAFIPGSTFWEENTLEDSILIKSSPGTERHIIESDTIEEKMSALKVPESLKASLLCGLVEPSGSAKFLNDSKSSSHQARVTLQYSVTTKIKELAVTNLSYPSGCNPQPASHVVTGVQYGAQVFFVFDQEVSPSEDPEEIQQNLQAMLKRMPRILPDQGEEVAKFAEKEKTRTEKISCRIYSDLPLADYPMTYQEAVDIYLTLPKLLVEKAVPVRVWLHPLNLLDSKIVCHFHVISSGLISEVQNILQQLMEIDKQYNDLAKCSAAITFPEIKRKLQRFQALYQQHRENFRKRLSRTIPLIRRGEEEEDALVDILTNKQQSLFSAQKLSAFLDRKEQEMTFVNYYLDALKCVEVVPTKKELDRVLADPLLRRIIAFVFTSLQDEESYISDLETSLASKKTLQPVSMTSISENLPARLWFENREIIKKARESVRDFLRVGSLHLDETKLIISALPDQDHPGVSIYLYEDGELVSPNFEPPSKPSLPVIGEIRHDAVQLTFKPAACGKAEISGYRVEYRVSGQETWVAVNAKDKQDTFTVTGLHPNTAYQFRYAAVGKVGLSESSDISEVVKTPPVPSPGKTEKAGTEGQASNLTFQGSSTVGSNNGEQETEQLEGKEDAKVNEKKGKPSEEAARMKQYDNDEEIQSVCRNDLKFTNKPVISESPSPQEGHEKVTDKIVKKSTLLESGPPPIYLLQLKKSASSSDSFLKYRLGNEDPRIPCKVIMVMGATGSGKTTLINGMINYILGVEWEDGFRFKLVHEQTNRSQAQSQTSEVTAYEINYRKGFRIPYSLTIIDTPGFGDTRGIKNDKLIIEKIRAFFSTLGGIDHIDGVCFVVQASLARLTQTQKYVFDSVLSIFGKDIKTNILILVTFADGQLPPVLEAVLESEVPCAKDDNDDPVHFKFNNSALFANNSAASENFDAMFWKMGAISMKTFFDSLHKLEPRSLMLTKEVLSERKRLEIAVMGLQPQIKVGLMKLEELRKTNQALEQHRDEMDANKDFEVEIEKPVALKIEVTDGFLTNCQKCHFTCHYPCAYANDQDKHKCSAMDGKGYCSVCPSKCVWNVHFNQKYRWEYKTETEKQTYSQIKEKYERACGEVMTAEKVFVQLSEEYEVVEDTVLELIEESSRSIQRLQEIALRPNPMGTPEHIDLLIEAEKNEAKPGFQERIKSLEGVREMAVIVNKIARGEPLLPEEQKVARKHKSKSGYSKLWNKFTGWIYSLKG